MRTPPGIGALALALALTACTATSGPTVLPIDDLLTSEIVVSPDASGTFALLEVSTDLPVVCSVVYGTTDAFGLIATDDDMAGGAHNDHHPRLRGLTPDTTYRYRVQGSDAAGNLYQSDVLTFTTPAAPAAPDVPGANIATEAEVIAASSEYSAGFAAANAIDGDLTTEWSSAGDGDDASITIDLGAGRDVVGIGFRSREMSDGTAIIQTYTVTVDDGEVLGPFDAGIGLAVTEVAFTGRVLRFDAATTTGGNTGAVEIEIYAAS